MAKAAHPRDAVVYTGTHDHATLAGWWTAAPPEERQNALHDLAEAAQGHRIRQRVQSDSGLAPHERVGVAQSRVQ